MNCEIDKRLPAEHLEQFITVFFNEQDPYAKAGKLHSFASSFLHSLKEDDLETKNNFYLNLIPKIPALFNLLVNVNSSVCASGMDHENDEEKKTLNLQASMMYLEAVSMCLACPKTNEQLLSIVQTSLLVLYDAYNHCKESEIFYADLLEEFTDQLAHFFKKIQDLQAALVGNFDQLFRFEESEINISAVVSISRDLGKLCEIVLTLDKVIAASLWRMFTKFITHYIDVVKEKQTVDSVLFTLISSITDMVEEYKVKLQNNEEIEEPDVKIFLFQLNLVMKIFHAFCGYIKESIQHCINFTLDLYDLLLFCCSPSTNEGSKGRLKKTLVNTIRVTVALFYSDCNFFNSVLQLHTKATSETHFTHVLLKMAALDYIHSIKGTLDHAGKEQCKELFMSLFLVLQTSKPEDDMKFACLKIPLSLFNCTGSLKNDEDRSVTLYELAYYQLSECSRIISDEGFGQIQNQMANLLFSSSDLVSLFVGDIWMYRLRCSSVDFLYNQCVVLSQNVLNKNSSSKLNQFLKRLLKFLPQDCKMKLFKENPQLEYFLHKSYEITPEYNNVESSELFCRKEYTDINPRISLLIKKLNCSSTDAELIVKACSILELFTLFVDVAQVPELLKFLEFATLVFNTGIFEVQMSVLLFLKSFNGKTLPENDPEFKRISSAFAALLTETIRSKNYIVKYEALKTYCNLAHSTPHPKILQLSAPDLITDIKSYITKVPPGGFITEKERLENCQRQLELFTFTNQRSSAIISEESRKILSQLMPP